MDTALREPPTFQRAPRIHHAVPQGKMEVPAPAPAPSEPSTNLLVIGLPAGGMLVMMGALLYFGLSGKGSWFVLVSIPLMLSSVIVGFVTHFQQKKKYRTTMVKRDERYNEVLDKYDKRLKEAYEKQQDALVENYPGILGCMDRAEKLDRRLWERSPDDEDFLTLRLGIGESPLSLELKVPEQEVAIELDPLIEKAQEIVDQYRVVKNVPVTIPLRAAGISGLAGPREQVLNTMRVMVSQIAAHHSPDEVKIVAVFPRGERLDWGWMRWLPHVWSDDRIVRFLADDKEASHEVLSRLYEVIMRRELQKSSTYHEKKATADLPYFVIFLSDPELVENEPVIQLLLSQDPELGAITVFMGDNLDSLPKECTVIAELEEGKGRLIRTATEEFVSPFVPDIAEVETAERLSRTMAPIRLKGMARISDIPKTVSLMDLWRARDVDELNITELWKNNRPYKSLAVPVGMKSGGKAILFDLHEKAHGPHGLVAGATGSGKSELLQSLICSLAINFHPHEVVFVLVDFKGGGMANYFLKLPHLVGVITNLEGSLAKRALIAIKSELKRRQELLAEKGVNHIDDYQKLYREGKADIPLPHLVIIIDEFAELASEQPDFMSELVSAVRVGRSLGVHLILATQKPAGVVSEQIWSNSRFRMCLRVERPEDSREVLKRPDAAKITLPGRAYLQVGNDEMFELFQSAWSGAPYAGIASAGDDGKIYEVTLDGSRIIHKAHSEEKVEQKSTTQLDAAVAYLNGIAEKETIKRLPGPWLPPLPEEIFFEDIASSLPFGWDGRGWQEPGDWLNPFVGAVDDPANQSQRALFLNLGKEGHLALYGIPGSGKTTFAQTLIRSLSYLYSPENVHVYLMDFGGRTLSLFKDLPHVGDVVYEDEEERVKALLRFLTREMERRKGLFSECGVNTLPAYRSATGETLPAIVVFLDNYASFAALYQEELEDVLARLVQEGGNTGIHFVISATGQGQIRTKISSNIALTIALELADLGDYAIIVGRTDGLYPASVPGRGLVKTAPPLEFQTALPAYGDTESDRANAIAAYVEEVASRWEGPAAPRIPTLPDELMLDEVIDITCEDDLMGGRCRIATIGLDADTLEPFEFDLEDGPHFLIAGSTQSGKTTLMQTILLSLCTSNRPDMLRLYLVDFGYKNLRAFGGAPHTAHFVQNSEGFDEAINEISEELSARRNLLEGGEADLGGSMDPMQALESRPLLVMAIDDFYLFGDMASPESKDELERMIRRERGLGFHVIMAGATNDLSACWDGYAKALMEMQTGCLLGSTGHEELNIFKARLPSAELGLNLPSGLGYFAKRGQLKKIKAALSKGSELSLSEWIEKLSRMDM